MSGTPNLDRAWATAKDLANQAYDTADALSLVEHETRAELEYVKRELVVAARRIGEGLIRLGDGIEANPPTGDHVNPLGVLQADALEIDRRCAEIGRLRQVLSRIAAARKAVAK